MKSKVFLNKLTLIRVCKLSSPAFVFLALTFLIAVNDSAAQPPAQFSAFTTCIDSDGVSSLCTQQSWVMAEGFSAEEQGFPALLGNGIFSSDSGQEACANSLIPASIEVSLVNPNLVIGERLYFEDIIIEAFNEDGEFLPFLPVIIAAISQDGMLAFQPNWEYVQVSSFGYATLMASFYCGRLAQVVGDFTLLVTP